MDRSSPGCKAPVKAVKSDWFPRPAAPPSPTPAQVVAAAHRLGIAVRPWVGPSSILLGLMASGLDGQRFAFHGYAPVDAGERAKQLRAWEQHSARHDQTQLLIETPTATPPCTPRCWPASRATPGCAWRGPHHQR